MPFIKGNPYRIKPKYTEKDMDLLRKLVKEEVLIEDIFAIMKKRRPDVSPMTVWRWVEKVAREEQ